MNRVILIGRLVRDPELRHAAKGTSVARFTLAVDRRPRSDGAKEADFIQIVVWGKMGETCHEHLGKGRLVAVDGRLQMGTTKVRMDRSTPLRKWWQRMCAFYLRSLPRLGNQHQSLHQMLRSPQGRKYRCG